MILEVPSATVLRSSFTAAASSALARAARFLCSLDSTLRDGGSQGRVEKAWERDKRERGSGDDGKARKGRESMGRGQEAEGKWGWGESREGRGSMGRGQEGERKWGWREGKGEEKKWG